MKTLLSLKLCCSNRPPPLGSCEWSSLKEVTAWIMRTQASSKGAEDIPWLAEFGGLVGVADLVEHTSACDSWLAGDGSACDIPPNFLEDFLASQVPQYSKGRSRPTPRAVDKELNVDVVLAALDAVHIPENSSRGNVRQTPDQVLEAMCLGAVSCRSSGVQASKHTRERPILTALLVRFVKEHLRRKKRQQPQSTADFTFSSIQVGAITCRDHHSSSHPSQKQVNKNYASALHVDGNNAGPSLIIALGDFEGGQLWTFDKGVLDVKNQVRCCLRTCVFFAVGGLMLTKERCIHMNSGRSLTETCPMELYASEALDTR